MFNKRIIAYILFFSVLLCNICVNTNKETYAAVEIDISSKSAILMEASTGKIIYEKNPDEKMPPASITKIMTLLLIFEAIDKGELSLDEMVTTSEEAAKMGGSNVYLEAGEQLSVDDMIKCISISSANDAAYAMGERLGGTIDNFVVMMNDKAKELGMNNTHFVNCHGLDAKDHYSTARDIAIMSGELISKHPQITKYSTTWMDSIIHKTKRGEQKFDLSNTNKLVRTYEGITGLKTGSTADAGYCLSATAKRNDIDLIAVVMNSKDHKSRFSECKQLLDYGFSKCCMYRDDLRDKYFEIDVSKGKKDKVYGKVEKEFKKLYIEEKNFDKIRYEIMFNEDITAPVKYGEELGEVIYYDDDKEIGRVTIYADSEVEKAGFFHCLKTFARFFF